MMLVVVVVDGKVGGGGVIAGEGEFGCPTPFFLGLRNGTARRSWTMKTHLSVFEGVYKTIFVVCL
jgi:hypothetical protein